MLRNSHVFYSLRFDFGQVLWVRGLKLSAHILARRGGCDTAVRRPRFRSRMHFPYHVDAFHYKQDRFSFGINWNYITAAGNYITSAALSGIFMPCVCVMHCRRRFFFGKNDVPGFFMPCVCDALPQALFFRKKWRSCDFYALCVCDALPQALVFSEKMTFLRLLYPVCVW